MDSVNCQLSISLIDNTLLQHGRVQIMALCMWAAVAKSGQNIAATYSETIVESTLLQQRLSIQRPTKLFPIKQLLIGPEIINCDIMKEINVIGWWKWYTNGPEIYLEHIALLYLHQMIAHLSKEVVILLAYFSAKCRFSCLRQVVCAICEITLPVGYCKIV